MIHTAVTLLLTGLIWMVQVVHYPLMARVGEKAFAEYHAAHARQISILVVPLMLVELATGVGLVFFSQPPIPLGTAVAGLALLAVVWGSTFFLQVPQHRKLTHGFDPGAHRLLVGTNWIRTAAWTVRSGLVGAAMIAAG